MYFVYVNYFSSLGNSSLQGLGIVVKILLFYMDELQDAENNQPLYHGAYLQGPTTSSKNTAELSDSVCKYRNSLTLQCW